MIFFTCMYIVQFAVIVKLNLGNVITSFHFRLPIPKKTFYEPVFSLDVFSLDVGKGWA